MDDYLKWCGILANGVVLVLVLIIIWQSFIYTFIEAISILRWLLMAGQFETSPSFQALLKVFYYYYKQLLFGRDFTTLSNKKGIWRGVGDYEIFDTSERK
jgi:hypothetical protein